jgi:MoaA/NifB/PqqE/SkfB family radical SAM enzyme
MIRPSFIHTIKRLHTEQTSRISAMPIVILMPHSACNCRCIMCDIWKGNHNLKQLTYEDVEKLILSLRKLGTRQVLFSGGEALLHPAFFQLCALLKKEGLHLTLLSTGITLKKHALPVTEFIDDLIVSLDGDEATHDRIRNIPGAYQKLADGITAIRQVNPAFPISARTVIHQLNYRVWPEIINSAKKLGLNSISFLPADVSSEAFNRATPWEEERKGEVAVPEAELEELLVVTEQIILNFGSEIDRHFISESRNKLRGIVQYYSAIYGQAIYPEKKCNAPWVSAVVEPDGSVRSCFFHPVIGNIHQQSLTEVLNSKEALDFRRQLDMDKNETCKRCVCSLYLPAWVNPGKKMHAS